MHACSVSVCIMKCIMYMIFWKQRKRKGRREIDRERGSRECADVWNYDLNSIFLLADLLCLGIGMSRLASTSM